MKHSVFLSGLFVAGLLPLTAQVSEPASSRVVEGSLPIVFEPALASPDSSATIISRVAEGTVGFGAGAIEINNGKIPGGFVVSFDGAQAIAPEGIDLQQSQTNYLLGGNPELWRTHVPNYARVIYSGLYKGIDALFYGNGGSLEHDFVVRPGADYRQIRLHFPSGSRVRVEQDGALTVSAAGDRLRIEAPSIYQNVNGRKEQREGGFQLLKDGDVGFAVSSYDRTLDLVIDPVLDFSTYLSPLGSDGSGIATDTAGNSYVTGYGSVGYPVTNGAFSSCTSCSTSNVVTFISKLSADGSKLIYSTVLGGNSFAQPTGIAVDANGDAIVSGWTGASNFPTKSGQSILQQGDYSGFLVSLSPDGSSLNYGTLLGSSPTAAHGSMTYATAVAIDSTGNAYVTGETGDGFFISNGALNQAVAGNSSYNTFDVFLAKFSPTGALVYSSVLGTADPQTGGGGPIGASAIAVDTAGDAYVAGQAGTHWPITGGAYLSQIAGSMPYATPFVMKVAPDARSVLYSTYLDYAYVVKGIVALQNGNVFVTGNNPSANYPTTSGAYQANNGSGSSPFLTELNASGSALVYSTMVCGSCTVYGMTVDPNGNIWFASQTSSTQMPLQFPLQSIIPSSQGVVGVGPASFLSEFDPTGHTLRFSTLLGGMAAGHASSVAVDSSLRVHVSGAAQYGMYTSAGGYAGSVPAPGQGYASSTYAYVALIDPAVSAPALCVSPGYSFSLSTSLGSSIERKLTITSCGAKPLTISGATAPSADFSVPVAENSCIQSLPVGQSCTLNVRFAPTTAGTQSSVLTIASDSPIPAMLPLGGVGTTAPAISLSVTSLTFGPQLLATRSAAQTITITNTGNAALSGIGFGMLATYEPIFPFTYTCTGSLAPGSSCTVSIAFLPASIGNTATTILIEPASGLPVQQVSLSGTASQPGLQLSPQSGGNTTATVTAGTTATYALAINAPGGYSGSVTLSCSNLPANASCTFAPPSFTLTGGTPAAFTVSITTASTQSAALRRTGEFGVAFAGVLLLLPFKRTRRLAAGLTSLGAVLIVTSLAGCSGGSQSAPGPQAAKVAPGTYTVQVAASDTTGNQNTQAITLIVQ